jgi:PKD repeat protein
VEIKTWKWSFGDGKTSEAQNPDHTYEKPGVYEVTCTITTSLGCNATRTTKFTVQAPTLPLCPGAFSLVLYDPTGSATVCNGKAVVTLLDEKAKPYTGVKYTWSHGATGDTVKNLCPNKQYIVQAVVETVCQKSASFSFLSTPVMRVEAANGKYAFYVDSPADGIIYKWDFGDGNVAYGPTVENSFDQDGVYEVKLTAISGNSTAESSQKVGVITGNKDLSRVPENEIEIYPNPARNQIYIDFNTSISGEIGIDVIDMKGQTAITRKLILSGQHFVELETSQLSDGLFFLRINNKGKTFTGLKFYKGK